MKNKAFLIYNLFFDVEKAEPTIGGIQTYICDLASVFSKLDYDVVIIQEGLENTSIDWNGYQIRVLKSKIGNIKFISRKGSPPINSIIIAGELYLLIYP